MIKFRSKGDKLFDFINITLVLIISIILLYPLIFVVNASFSDPTRLFETPLLLFPRGFNLEGYRLVVQNENVLSGFVNSVIYTVLGTSVNIIMTTLAAYPLSRKELKGRGIITFLFVFTMFFSGGLIPTFLVNQQLGIINTIWVMILPGSIGVFNMILMRSYFQQSIPRELEESAFIDGATDMQLLLKVILPLSAPIIAVMMMFYGVGRWNSFFDAMIYLQDRSRFPLQLILREILLQGRMGDAANQTMIGMQQGHLAMMRMSIQYGVIVVSTVPVLLFYPVVSKYFEKGVMIGSIKG